MASDPDPPLSPVVTYGCEHLTVSVIGTIGLLTFGCGCTPQRIVGNTTAGSER